MKYKILIILCFILFATLLACKKTKTDLSWEQKLINNKWEPLSLDKRRIIYIPIFEFNEGNRGKSYLIESVEKKDEFGWEIRRKELRLFYDKAPSDYNIGQDKYNSKALFRIKSVNDSIVELTHLSASGYASDYLLRKIN